MIWRQDLGLGDDAVWQTVLPALGGDLSPGDLEACDSLIGRHPGHTPQEVTGDVSFIDGEGSREVLWLGQNLWLPSFPRAWDVFVSFAPDGSTGRGEEGCALVLGASLGLQHVNSDFVLAGKQQAREVDVVLLCDRFLWSSSLIVAAVLRHPLHMIATDCRISSVLPVDTDL